MIELRVTLGEYLRVREAINRAEDAAASFEPGTTPTVDIRQIAGAIVGEQVAGKLFGCVKVFVDDDGPVTDRIREV